MELRKTFVAKHGPYTWPDNTTGGDPADGRSADFEKDIVTRVTGGFRRVAGGFDFEKCPFHAGLGTPGGSDTPFKTASKSPESVGGSRNTSVYIFY